MQREEIRLDRVYCDQSSGYQRAIPLVPVVAVAELSLMYELSANPAVHRAIKGNPLARTRLQNIGLCFTPGDVKGFQAWAESQDEESRPPVLDVALDAAARLREWFGTIPEGEHRAVPADLIPGTVQLRSFRSRDLTGEWLRYRGEQISQARRKREAEQQADLTRREQQDVFGAITHRMLTLLDVSEVKPGTDFYRQTDYTRVQVPLKVLAAMLDELEVARGGGG